MMQNIAAIGYLISGIFFALLTFLLAINWRGKLQGGFLILACSVSVAWSFSLAYQLVYQSLAMQTLWVLETLRSFSWLIFLSYVLWELFTSNQISRKWLIFLSITFTVISLFLVIPHETILNFTLQTEVAFINDLRVVLFLAIAIIGISLIEQLFRNTSIESRWTIKYLCLGLGLGFFYDFYL